MIKKSSNDQLANTDSSSSGNSPNDVTAQRDVMEQIGKDFRMTLYASITKQMLNCNSSASEDMKQEKLLMKDMIKSLNAIMSSSNSWVHASWVSYIPLFSR